MKKFEYLEDYIEFMIGQRLATGQLVYNWSKVGPIRLANYDVQILKDIGTQINGKVGLTEKQKELCTHLITKYARQLRKFGVEQPDPTIPCRYSIRSVDRSKRLTIQDNYLSLRFPFNNKLITEVRDMANKSIGHMNWHKLNSNWQIAGTETNIIKAVELALQREIEVDEELLDMYKQLKDEQQKDWAIELVCSKDGYAIRNAAESLNEYIIEHCGGFGKSNLLNLIDNASRLGYTLSKDIQVALRQEYSQEFIDCLNAHSTVIRTDLFVQNVLPDLINWMLGVKARHFLIYDPLGELAKYDVAFDDRLQQFSINKDLIAISPNTATSYTDIDAVWTVVSFFSMMSYNSKHNELMQKTNRLIYVGSKLK